MKLVEAFQNEITLKESSWFQKTFNNKPNNEKTNPYNFCNCITAFM
jgi:hypothetical protein